VTVADREQNTASDTDSETVTVGDGLPIIDLQKEVSPSSLPEPGGVFTYTLTITNNSDENVTITELSDSSPLPSQCMGLIGDVLVPGQSVFCSYDVAHSLPGSYLNNASVTVTDNEENTATDTATKTATVIRKNVPPTPPPPAIIPVTGGETHAITAGTAHTCVITGTGGVQCWGDNVFGQLGDGTNTDSNVPVDVVGLTGGTSIVAGGYHTCLLAASDVWCWGRNTQGQIGDGTTTNRNKPVKVLSGAVDITAGLNYTCAVMQDGKVMCWGDNYAGQLADGSKSNHTTPTLASLITGVLEVDAGRNQSCGITPEGTVRCVNTSGAKSLSVLFPVINTIPGFNMDVSVDRFGSKILALDSSGTPVVLQNNVAKKIDSIQGAIDIDSGFSHICTLLADGAVECWGSNLYGQLGDNSTSSGQDPRPVIGLMSAWQLAVGRDHTCVLVESNTPGTNEIQCWGLNTDGQLGNGTNINSLVPVFVIQ
jgi:uncharacterized repeat protein (TIGR01451 family)